MIAPTWGVAQSVQRGEVLEYRGTDPKTPLAEVNVVASNAGAVQSDAEGRFSLQFRTLHSGDAIQFRRIERSGYEVMNKEALEVARVARPSTQDEASDRIRIVMIPRATLQRLRDGYRNVTEQRYEQQLQLAEAQLDSLRQAGKLAEEQYNARINALEEAHEEKLNQLDTYIDKFARIDLSDLDQDEQRIVALVQEGRFEEALQIYEEQHLSERLQQNRADIGRLSEMRDQLSEAARKKAIENERLRQSIDRQVTLLRMAGGEENYMRVHQILYETFLADTTYAEARREYAFSLRGLGQNKELLTLLKSGIAIEKDPYAKGMMVMDVSQTYWNTEEYELSIRYAEMADSIMTPVMESNYAVVSRGLPSWSLYKLRYYKDLGDMEQCRKVVDRLMANWAPDTMSLSSIADYNYVLGDMSDYYSLAGDHQQSVWAVHESIRLGEIYCRQAPWNNTLHEAYTNATSVLMAEGRRSEACAAARRAVELMGLRLDKNNMKVFYNENLLFYFLLAETLVPAEEYALADSIMQDVVRREVFEKAGQENSLYALYITLFRYYEARVWLSQGRIEDAQRQADATLAELSRHEDGAGFVPYLRGDIEARIAWARQDYDAAVRSAQSALEHCQAQYAESGDNWDADNVCRCEVLLAQIYLAAGQRGKCQKALKRATKLAPFEFNRQAIAAVQQSLDNR